MMQSDAHDPLAAMLLLALLFSPPRAEAVALPAKPLKKRVAPPAVHLKRAANYGGAGASWSDRP